MTIQLWVWLGQPVGLLPLLSGTALALALESSRAGVSASDRRRASADP